MVIRLNTGAFDEGQRFFSDFQVRRDRHPEFGFVNLEVLRFLRSEVPGKESVCFDRRIILRAMPF